MAGRDIEKTIDAALEYARENNTWPVRIPAAYFGKRKERIVEEKSSNYDVMETWNSGHYVEFIREKSG